MSDTLETMRDFFNNRAHVYDAVHLEHIDGGMESKQIIASLLPKHVKTLLDLGVGTGLELDAIFGRFPGIHVTGLDVAQNMLDLCVEKYPGKHLYLRHDSYLNCDLGTNLYDAALSVMSLHHYSHSIKANLYQKIYNCIRIDGVYIECDYMLSESEYDDPQQMEDFYFAERKRLMREQNITDDGDYHYDTPRTVTNQINMLQMAGFITVKETWRKKNTVILTAQKK